MQDVVYLVTGAAGHLGGAVAQKLADMGKNVRALVLPGDKNARFIDGRVVCVEGDVCEKGSLEKLFDVKDDCEIIVIHAAGIVSIAAKYDQKVYDVNVEGTKNIIDMCRKHGAKKLVYVSTSHAIEERPRGETMEETKAFDPDRVVGLYAKTKAEATREVLAAEKEGLFTCVVHPSGIVGPGDRGRGHVTQLVIDYCRGALTACVEGGYDFVDVRDVADGIISCCENGRSGECYLLTNRYFSVKEILSYLHEITGKNKVKTVLPMWFAKMTAPLSEMYYKLLRQPPLYTAYSLYTLNSNGMFTHKKADEELYFKTRPMRETLRDTVEWLEEIGRIK